MIYHMIQEPVLYKTGLARPYYPGNTVDVISFPPLTTHTFSEHLMVYRLLLKLFG